MLLTDFLFWEDSAPSAKKNITYMRFYVNLRLWETK